MSGEPLAPGPQFIACAVALLFLTACTTNTAGTARPATDAPVTTTTPSETRPAGAPNVTEPLDISRFVGDPCLVLTASQAQQLGLPQTGVLRDGALGKACRWSNRQTFLSISINMLNEDPAGLSAFYRANEAGKWAYFEPVPSVEGYPAVAYDALDSRADGKCAVVVGTANELAFDTAIQVADADIGKTDPCEAAIAAVALMMRTMKGA